MSSLILEKVMEGAYKLLEAQSQALLDPDLIR